jgi:hypothetical protein
VIVEFEVSRPFQKRPGRYRSRRTPIRVWWAWFAVAVYRGDAKARSQAVWEDR